MLQSIGWGWFWGFWNYWCVPLGEFCENLNINAILLIVVDCSKSFSRGALFCANMLDNVLSELWRCLIYSYLLIYAGVCDMLLFSAGFMVKYCRKNYISSWLPYNRCDMPVFTGFFWWWLMLLGAIPIWCIYA